MQGLHDLPQLGNLALLHPELLEVGLHDLVVVEEVHNVEAESAIGWVYWQRAHIVHGWHVYCLQVDYIHRRRIIHASSLVFFSSGPLCHFRFDARIGLFVFPTTALFLLALSLPLGFPLIHLAVGGAHHFVERAGPLELVAVLHIHLQFEPDNLIWILIGRKILCAA